MNTKLLRDDELGIPVIGKETLAFIALLRQRLIEEREKNAQIQLQSVLECEGRLKAEAELAKVREMLRDMTSPNCQCGACCSARDYFAVSS